VVLQSAQGQLKSAAESANNAEIYNKNLQKQIDDYQSQMDEMSAG